MGWLGDFFSNPIDSIGSGFQTLWNAGADIPGSPEAVYNAFDGAMNGDYSWNPYDPNGASAWDVIGGGESLSEDPNNRRLGRTVGTAIGTYFTGGALGNYLGSASAGNAAAGALSSGAQAAATDGDVGDAMLKGGTTSYLNSISPNYAGYAGVTNPVISGAINGGVNAGLRSAASGGDVQKSINQGAVSGGVQGGLSDLFSPTPEGTIGGTVEDSDGNRSTLMGGTTQEQYDANTQANAADRTMMLPTEGTQPSFVDSVKQALGGISLGDGRLNFGDNQGIRYGDLAQGLMGLYGGYQQRRQAKDLRDLISGRRGAYETNMRNNIMGKMRAGGKRGNISGREMQLQAAMADLDSRNAPMYANLNNQEFAGLANMLQAGNMMLNRGGFYGQPKQPQSLSTLQTLNTTPMVVDYSLQPKQKNPFSLGG